MNLRNRKTREIGYYLHTHRDSKTGVLKIAVLKDGVPFSEFKPHEPVYDYDSLAKLYGEWEDYTPAEPLIKDEKIRKAVRAWAEANEVTKVYVYGIGDGKEYIELYAKDDGVTDGRIRISLPIQDGVWIGEEYSIIELCGEEEE